MKNLSQLILALMLMTSLVLVGCGGGGGSSIGGYSAPKVTAQSFVDRLNELDPEYYVYIYEVDKDDTFQPGYIVFYDAFEDDTVAIDIQYLRDYGYSATGAANAYMDGGLASISEFADWDSWESWFWDEDTYVGRNTGLLYDFENQLDIASKDLFAVKAKAEESNNYAWAQNVAFTYDVAMSEAQNIVSNITAWNTVPEHAKTDKDATSLIKATTGFSYDQLVEAYKENLNGNQAPTNALLNQAVSAGKFPTVDSARNFLSIMKDDGVNKLEPTSPF